MKAFDKIKETFRKVREFLQIDKTAHILASALICLAIGGYMIEHYHFCYDGVVVPYIFAPMFTFIIGFIKEAVDDKAGGTSDPQDIIADIAGCVIGLILMLVIFV